MTTLRTTLTLVLSLLSIADIGGLGPQDGGLDLELQSLLLSGALRNASQRNGDQSAFDSANQQPGFFARSNL